jgi:hypothetical protein
MPTIQIKMERNDYNDGWKSDRFIHMEGERNSYYSAGIADKGRASNGGELIDGYAFIYPRTLVIDNHGGSSRDINQAIEARIGDRITLLTGITHRTFTLTKGGFLSDPKLIEVK